ncbi:MAG: DUF6036 family nucleotidyltransferase [Thermoplasmata archaeon]
MRTMEDTVRAAVSAMEEAGVQYVVVGGIATAAWGTVRTTMDVDVIVSLAEDEIEGFVSVLTKHGFRVNRDDIEAALEEKSHFTAMDPESGYHLDLKGSYSRHDASTLGRRREVLLDDLRVCVASPEDLLAMKLLMGSDRDLADAKAILIRQAGKLDMEYLEDLCRRLGVSDELRKIAEKI